MKLLLDIKAKAPSWQVSAGFFGANKRRITPSAEIGVYNIIKTVLLHHSIFSLTQSIRKSSTHADHLEV